MVVSESMAQGREVHVERLLGRRVRDFNGVVIGRLEELRCETVDGETVVVEVHVGPAALSERLGGFLFQLPFFRYIRFERWEYRVRWDQLDLADPDHPRLHCTRDELRRVGAES
jgi:sporulation protein YlmC with PRC-barrel domain